MSDFKIPDLPSDDELGINEKDLEEFLDKDAPEMSDKEMAALLGESPRKTPPPPPPPGKKTPKGPPKKSPKSPPKDPSPRPQEPSGPRSRWRGPGVLAALVILAFLSSSSRYLPSPVPANAPDTAFSSARAMAHLVDIARRAHPTGSPAHTQVRDYLLERMRDLGLEPAVQTTTVVMGGPEGLTSATVRNIVARIPGRASTGAVLLTTHYDGAGLSRAAGDAGTGVVSVLETLRALGAGAPMKNDLIVLITDAEELGLLGVRGFLADHPWAADVSAAISLEMRGSGGPSLMFETGADNGWIVRTLAASGTRPFVSSVSYELYRRLPNDTDFTPLKGAGIQGLNFAAIGRASLYHQPYDTPENLSEATLQHQGASALAVTRALGNADLSAVTDSDVTFFSLPVLGVVVYPMDLVLPLAAAVLALAALVLLFVRRAGGRWGGILAGFLLGALTVGVTAGVGYAVMAWVPRFHPEYGSIQGSAFHHEGWYLLVLVAAGLAVTTTLFGLARRRFTPASLAWGALLLPLGGMAYVSWKLPGGAMVLQWPLMGTLLGVALLAAPDRGKLAAVLTGLTVLLMVPALAFWVPLAELTGLALSFRAAPVLGGTCAVALLLLLPALFRLREPNAWWAPLTALALAGAFLGLGVRAARPTEARPAPSTLALALDHGSGEVLWVTDTSTLGVDSAATAWAADRAGGTFTETRSLERLAYGFRGSDARVRPGPEGVVQTPAPELWALSDTVAAGVRHLRVGIRSRIGAEMMAFVFPEGGATHPVAINGHALPDGARPTLLSHWGVPDPIVVLDLEMPEGASPEMDVVEHMLRPQELVGDAPFQRPPTLAPDIRAMSDRFMARLPAGSLGIIPGPPPFSLEPEGIAGSPPVDPPVPAESTAQPADSLSVPDTVARPDTVVPDTTASGRSGA